MCFQWANSYTIINTREYLQKLSGTGGVCGEKFVAKKQVLHDNPSQLEENHETLT